MNCSDAGTWDPVRIAEVFWPTDREAILSIPLSSTRCGEKLIWNYEIWMPLPSTAGCTGRGNQLKYCMAMVDCNLETKRPPPPRKNEKKRVQLFTWRVYNDALPTKGKFFKRSISETSCCPTCGKVETSIHALFACAEAKSIWKHAGYWESIKPYVGETETRVVMMGIC